MMLIVWLVVGIGALLFLGVIGFGLFGQLKRLRAAVGDAQREVAPQVAELNEGIRRAQALRMQSGAGPTRDHGRHA